MSENYFRWSATDMMREFHLKKSAVFSKLSEAGLTCTGGEYSTLEVVRALYPDLKQERAELVRLQKEEQQMRVSQMRGELVNADEMVRALETIFVAIRQIVMTSELPRPDREDLLSNMASLQVVWDEGRKRSQALVNYREPEPLEREDEKDQEQQDRGAN